MEKERISVAGMSVLLALGLAVWEVYFFWFAGRLTSLEGPLGWFSSERLGFNMAWLASIYLTFQLIAVPFSIPTSANRFLGVVDGIASLIPLAVVLVAVFGGAPLMNIPQRWEAALLLILITAVDLFGGYTLNIALSRRTANVASAASA
jgi:hypothetical protein